MNDLWLERLFDFTTSSIGRWELWLECKFYFVLAVINGTDVESDSENESDNDDSVLDKKCEMPIDQLASYKLLESPEAKNQLDKAAFSQKAGKST